MPRKPPIACSQRGCSALVESGNNGLCDKHRAERHRHYTKTRSDSEHTKIYKTKAWQTARKMALYRDAGWCTRCEEAPAELVDHIIELKDGGKPYDLENLQCLCHKCHAQKTREAAKLREQGQIYGK